MAGTEETNPSQSGNIVMDGQKAKRKTHENGRRWTMDAMACWVRLRARVMVHLW